MINRQEGKAKAVTRIYGFLSLILPYSKPEWGRRDEAWPLREILERLGSTRQYLQRLGGRP